jgi:hypothetical protein
MIEENNTFLFMLGAIAFLTITVWVAYINIILICFINDKVKYRSETYRRFEEYMRDED